MTTVSQATSSSRLYARALKSLPGGVSRNTVLHKPHPFYADYASGCHIVDVEGVDRIDFANNMAALIHGHAHPEITAAVTRQIQKGTSFTMPTEVEIEFAEHLRSRNRGFDKLRFVNSGTEAVMAAIRAARAYTGRPKIAKVEGAYHGAYDYAEVSQLSNPSNWGSAEDPARIATVFGTPEAVLADVVIIPFNDVEKATAILDRHKGEIACVIIDLMPHRVGLTKADTDFAHALRDWTKADGSLLVVDEVITFRSQYGGMQVEYGLDPDITSMGKIIGGGFPVGAIAGQAEVMEVMNPLANRVLFPHSGTFSANPVTMVAGLTAMGLYGREAVDHVNRLGARAIRGIEKTIADVGAKAAVSGGGSLFRVHLKESVPQNYREAYMTPDEARSLSIFIDSLFDDGFLMMNSGMGSISTVMTEVEVDSLVEAMGNAFEKVAAAG